MTKHFPHLVIDGFLPADLHAGLLGYALEKQDAFTPTGIYSQRDGTTVREDYRKSWSCDEGLGIWKKPFRAVVHARREGLLRDLQMPDFEVMRTEIQLVAHLDGSFFRPHIDTLTQRKEDGQASIRALTLVYYFHAQPKGFAGGEIALFPLGPGDRKLIEPRDNRLVAFPSMVPHEVEPVRCADPDFARARFAVNCWLHKPR